MPGTGGFRKLRFARPGMGKSGGVRVIYYFHDEGAPINLIAIYAKAKKEALTKEQCNELYDLAQVIKKGK